jgi:hypothetical protein
MDISGNGLISQQFRKSHIGCNPPESPNSPVRPLPEFTKLKAQVSIFDTRPISDVGDFSSFSREKIKKKSPILSPL